MNYPYTQLSIDESLGISGFSPAKPVLKWAGGKSQLADILLSKIPKDYNRYLEPFFGGGALFFVLQPRRAVISDSNPELINLYRIVKTDVEQLISALDNYRNDEQMFYAVRDEHWEELDTVQAAARIIYLNHTCYNGLYRVNKQGRFNVPFGRYKNPRISNPENLRAASAALGNAEIVCGDYKDVLRQYAGENDLIFLDPPYLPISKYSDFKRYTKEQFYEEDHRELAEEIKRLHLRGCYVILTNSNHPLVHNLYKEFQIKVVKTKRHINKNGSGRTGEDVIVTIPPRRRLILRLVPAPLPAQAKKYPTTRYMGSKRKIQPYIWDIARQFDFHTVLDLFSGSGVIAYMFKSQGKCVYANDYMAMAATFATAMIENSEVHLGADDVGRLLTPNPTADKFVSDTFQGLYFSDKDNLMIDTVRANIRKLKGRYKRSVAMAALIRACMKKRARGIFTYVGFRYDDGRRDMHISLEAHFKDAVKAVSKAVFDNGQINQARCGDAMTVSWKPDMVYIDPPYYTPLADNEYVRRYHFVEGLARYWKDVEIQEHTKTKKFKNFPTPFSSQKGSQDAFDKLFRMFQDSIVIVSYSSNSFPTLDEIVALMSKYKSHVEVVSVEHRYSFGNQRNKIGNNNNKAYEYLFVGF
jgi:DNA adenine methylase